MQISQIFDSVRQMLDQGRVAEAVSFLDGYTQDFECEPQFHLLVSEACLAGQLPDRALAAADKAIGLQPNSALPYYQRGVVHLERGDFVAAKSDLSSAIALSDPTDVLRVGSQIQTAKCDIKAGLYDEALELLVSLVDQRKVEDTDIIYFADLLIDSGQTGRSLRLAQAALASDLLNNPEALRFLSGHACLEGQNEAAVQFLEHALRKDASHFGCLSDLGWICFLDGNVDRAEALLRKAIAVDPNHAHPRCSLAWLLSREQASDTAVREGLEIAQSMLDLPGYPEHRKYKVLARCQLHAGMRDEASKSIQHAVSCAPPDETEGLHEFIRSSFGDLDPH